MPVGAAHPLASGRRPHRQRLGTAPHADCCAWRPPLPALSSDDPLTSDTMVHSQPPDMGTRRLPVPERSWLRPQAPARGTRRLRQVCLRPWPWAGQREPGAGAGGQRTRRRRGCGQGQPRVATPRLPEERKRAGYAPGHVTGARVGWAHQQGRGPGGPGGSLPPRLSGISAHSLPSLF